MDSAATSLRLVCRSCRSQRPPQHLGAKVFVAWKSVASGGGATKASKVKGDGRSKPSKPSKPSKYDEMLARQQAELEKFRFMSATQTAQTVLNDSFGGSLSQDDLNRMHWGAINNQEIANMKDGLRKLTQPLLKPRRVNRDSFWDEGETDNDLITNDDSDEYDENDMTEVAHAKLEEIREQRQYARLAVWDMPLLATFVKPFQPPTADQVLRFRFTSYMGEYHSAENKVVVEFCPADFGLSEVQQRKLKKLAGPRYNPKKDVIKMSCESFEHQAQNKRHLAETIQLLLNEAKDPTDTFEDIPLDLRHHKTKVKPKFPPEWRMSDERMQQIVAYREEAKRLEVEKIAEGKFVDGLEAINKAVRSSQEAVPLPLFAGDSPKKPRHRTGARL